MRTYEYVGAVPTWTVEQFADFLQRLTRPTLAGVVLATVPPMVKRHRATGEPNPYLGRVLKWSRFNAFLAVPGDYKRFVDRALVREADVWTQEEVEAVRTYEPLESPYDRLGGALLGLRERRYADLICQNHFETWWHLDGHEPDTDQLALISGYLYERAEESNRPGLERPIVVRRPKLASFRYITLRGTQIALVHERLALPKSQENACNPA